MGFSHYCFTWKIINLMLTLQSIGWNELKNKEKKKKVNNTGYDVRSSIPVTTPPPPALYYREKPTKDMTHFHIWLWQPSRKFLLWSAMGNQYKKGEVIACILLKNNWKITNKRNICLIYHYAKMHLIFFSSHSFIIMIVTVVYDIESYS